MFRDKTKHSSSSKTTTVLQSFYHKNALRQHEIYMKQLAHCKIREKLNRAVFHALIDHCIVSKIYSTTFQLPYQPHSFYTSSSCIVRCPIMDTFVDPNAVTTESTEATGNESNEEPTANEEPDDLIYNEDDEIIWEKACVTFNSLFDNLPCETDMPCLPAPPAAAPQGLHSTPPSTSPYNDGFNYVLISRAICTTAHNLSCVEIRLLNGALDVVINPASQDPFRFVFNSNLENKAYPFQGIEDVRVVQFKDEWYYTACGYEASKTKISVCIDKLESMPPTQAVTYLEARFITPAFETKNTWEKNWVFFYNAQIDSLCVIYQWAPIYVCKVNFENDSLELLQTISRVPKIFKQFRGSTCGLTYETNTWFVVHLQRESELNVKYVHFFVVLNNHLEFIAMSKPFTFENAHVEYCLGLEVTKVGSDDVFLLSYSTNDKTTKSLGVRVDTLIKQFMKPMEGVPTHLS